MSNQINVCLFIRVSTDKQDYSRQVKELTEYCQQRNYTIVRTIATKITGAKTLPDRSDLQELLQAARNKEFSKVVISEISRLGRRAKDVRNTIDILHKLKIPVVFRNLGGLESLDENGQESFVTNIIIAIWAEVAEEEKRTMTTRIKSGLANARAKGKQIGRPFGSREPDEILKEYSKVVADIQRGFSLNQCVKLHGLSKNTIIKVKKTLRQVA
jgi:DNA invertase Pin-like site-specific DNA recombinase